MNPRRRDVLAQASAVAHDDMELCVSDLEAARRYATSRRTQARWRSEGPPVAREFHAYLTICGDPFRAEASVRTTIKQRVLAKLPTPALIQRYRDLLAHEPMIEAQDRTLDVSRGISWMERSAASERDAAIDAEKAACEREFAARGITEAEVFGGAR